MPQTPTYSWPYPALSDPPNGPMEIQALAEAIEPTVSGIDDRVTSLETLVLCRVRFTSTFPLVAGANLLAQGGWGPATGDDPLSMFSLGGDGFSRITIPSNLGGYWYVSFEASFDGLTGGRLVGINKNTTAPTSGFLTRDMRNANSAGGDGTRPHAHRGVRLAGGDILRWITWSSVNCNVGGAVATDFGLVAAEVEVRRIGD